MESAASTTTAVEAPPGLNKCSLDGFDGFSSGVLTVAKLILSFIVYLALCNGAHLYLKRLSQPRIISETLVALLISQIPHIKSLAINKSTGVKNMKFITDFGMICYMFVLGLEMDPVVLLQFPRQEAWVAYAGMISTFVLACSTVPFLHYADEKVSSKVFIFAVAIFLSSTGSPLLTRVLTDLKVGKSDIGQLAVSSAVHSELVAILVISVGYVIFQPENNFALRGKKISLNELFSAQPGLLIGAALLGQAILAAVVGPLVMRWVNNANPQGKTLKGSHLVLSLAFVVGTGSISSFLGFSPVLSAFVTGLFLPNEGRISKFMLTKINYFLSFVFSPYFFLWLGLETEFNQFIAGEYESWLGLFCFYIIGTAGKILGSILSGLMFGLPWQECIALGLLLNVKGHFHLYAAIIAKKNDIISNSTCVGIILAMLFKVIYIPLVAIYLVHRARQRFPNQRMALQWHDPSKELRVLFCFHGPQNVPAAISFMEISQGTADPGLVVYATDIVELTERVAQTLAPGDGVDAVTVTDESIVSMREEITASLQEYTEENNASITLRRVLALSTFSNMHQDICILAEDSMISLIVLPFHKTLQPDGKMDAGHSGFRYVNRKVLRTPPCSVAILVDRGLGSLYKISKSKVSLNVGVIFIGGKDDREALAFASRVAYHPGVRLTVIRFLLDTDAEGSSTLGALSRGRMAEQEEQMKLDDECFADFYEKQVAIGRVAYFEKHLVNSAQAYSTLQSLEGQYGLFIVGRGGRSNSVLTVGMNDLEQCPELGPLGDILSGPAFSSTASVLIIQQHIPREGGVDH